MTVLNIMMFSLLANTGIHTCFLDSSLHDKVRQAYGGWCEVSACVLPLLYVSNVCCQLTDDWVGYRDVSFAG